MENKLATEISDKDIYSYFGENPSSDFNSAYAAQKEDTSAMNNDSTISVTGNQNNHTFGKHVYDQLTSVDNIEAKDNEKKAPSTSSSSVPFIEYECTVCGRFFISLPHYNAHVEDHSKDTLDQTPKFRVNEELNGFNCLECGRFFSRRDHMRRHQKTHEPPDLSKILSVSVSCETCGKQYNRLDLLKRHQKRHEKRAKKAGLSEDLEFLSGYRCSECGKYFERQDRLKRHERVHEKVRAKVTSAGSVATTKKPRQARKGKARKGIKSELPAVTQQSEEDVLTLKNVIIKTECDIQNDDFGDANEAAYNDDTDTELNDYNGDSSGQFENAIASLESDFKSDIKNDFKSDFEKDLQNEFGNNVVNHLGNTNESCVDSSINADNVEIGGVGGMQENYEKLSEDPLKRYENVEDINNTILGEMSDCTTYPDVYGRGKNKGKFACSICGKRFPRMYGVKRHELTHANRVAREKDRKAKLDAGAKMPRKRKRKLINTSCEICGKYFTRSDHLKRHRLIHAPDRVLKASARGGGTDCPFKCDKCSRSFNKQDTLDCHRTVHFFKCEFCKEMFEFKDDLSVHLVIHKDEKPNICHICGKSFHLRKQLSKHKEVHKVRDPNAVPFVCSHCGLAFRTRRILVRHQADHLGRRFMCQMCGKAFKVRSDLSHHAKIHFGIKKHICPVCNKGFLRRKELNRHMATHRR